MKLAKALFPVWLFLLRGGLCRCDIPSDRQVCDSLRSGASSVVGVGLLASDRIVVVTDTDHVVIVPHGALQTSPHALYVFGALALARRWPVLANVHRLVGAQDRHHRNRPPLTALIDSTSLDYLLLVNHTRVWAFTLDQNSVIAQTFHNVRSFTGTVSTVEPMHFYAVNVSGAHNSIAVYDYHLKGSTELNHSTSMQISDPLYLCFESHRDSVYFSVSECQNTFKSIFQSGFTDGKLFYLFLDSSVYIFDHSAIVDVEKRVNFEIIPLATFLVCSELRDVSFKGFLKWIVICWGTNLMLTFTILYGSIFYLMCVEKSSISYNAHSSPVSPSSISRPKNKAKMNNSTMKNSFGPSFVKVSKGTHKKKRTKVPKENDIKNK